MATPNITREIFDGNLTRVTPRGVTNRRVVIIGTASDGPMYTPVRASSAGNAEDTFGSISDGTLVRGIKEALDAQAGFPKNPSVWGMRIGGLTAARATKDINDGAESLLQLEALFEGSVYNDVYMAVNTTLNEISIWNPKLKVFTTYKYNWDDANDATADVHSLQELVDAINADASLSSIMFAATPSNEISGEFVVKGSVDGFVHEEGIGKTVIHLNDSNASSGTDGYLAAGAGQANGEGVNSVLADFSKRFRDVTSAYSIYVSDFETITENNKQHVIDGKFILNNVGVDGGVRSIVNMTTNNNGLAACSSASEAVYHVKEKAAKIKIGSTEEFGDTANTMNTVDTVQVQFDIGDINVDGMYDGTTKYINPYAAAVDAVNHGDIKVELQLGSSSWITIDGSNAGRTLAWSTADQAGGGVVTVTLADDDTMGNVDLIDAGSGALEGNTDGVVSARVSFVSEKVTLSESASLTGLSTHKSFFVQGNNIYFGGDGPAQDMMIRFSEVKYYSPAEMLLELNVDKTGIITIYDGFQADKTANPDYATDDAIFGLNMRYYANVGSLDGNYYLAGGSNGTSMTNAQMYDDLDEAYDHFTADFFDIFTVMGANWDSTKTFTNDSGTLVSGNAGFAQQMSDFIDAFNGEIIGIMGFEPMQGSGVGGRILKSDVDARVGTVKQYVDGFHQPFMFANDIEGIFNAAGTRYGAGSSAAVAGLIAAIPTNEALYRYTVPGMLGMVWRYSEVDKLSGRKQIDLLSDARICCGQVETDGIKLTEAKTMAIAGSDFENLMTVLILQQTLDICRTVAKNYIGKVSSNALIQAFQSELNTAIGEALVPGSLRGFSAPITMTPGERVVGKLTIPLTLSPQFEIRDVHYSVTLTADDIVG